MILLKPTKFKILNTIGRVASLIPQEQFAHNQIPQLIKKRFYDSIGANQSFNNMEGGQTGHPPYDPNPHDLDQA